MRGCLSPSPPFSKGGMGLPCFTIGNSRPLFFQRGNGFAVLHHRYYRKQRLPEQNFPLFQRGGWACSVSPPLFPSVRGCAVTTTVIFIIPTQSVRTMDATPPAGCRLAAGVIRCAPLYLSAFITVFSRLALSGPVYPAQASEPKGAALRRHAAHGNGPSATLPVMNR
jgi:hypothetical protein